MEKSSVHYGRKLQYVWSLVLLPKFNSVVISFIWLDFRIQSSFPLNFSTHGVIYYYRRIITSFGLVLMIFTGCIFKPPLKASVIYYGGDYQTS